MLRVVLFFFLATAFFTGCSLNREGPVPVEKVVSRQAYMLEIHSKPPYGMDIIVDGVNRGRTPLALGLKPYNKVVVEVSGDSSWGYKKITAGAPGAKGSVLIESRELFYRASYLRGGVFTMGRKNGPSDERPEHEVFLDGFFMGEHEVTNTEFRRFVRDTRYKTDAGRIGSCWVFQNGLTRKGGVKWENIPLTGTVMNHPVTCVSWHDAAEYASWLSDKTGREYRMPTEAEWEYAATRGDGSVQAPESSGVENLNYCDKNCSASWAGSGDDGYVSLAPVKSYPPNSVGLFDMAGNVWEWCGDWYAKDYYEKSPKKNPAGPVSKFFKVVRGGSWLYPLKESEYRNRSYFKKTFRSTDVGFRLVLVP